MRKPTGRPSSYRPSMGGNSKRVFGKPARRRMAPSQGTQQSESASSSSGDDYYRRSDDGPGIGTALLVGAALGLFDSSNS